MREDRRCAVCGETDPMPASMCLAKIAGCAVPEKPCQYSVEGCERLRVAMEEQSSRYYAEFDRLARRAALPTGGTDGE